LHNLRITSINEDGKAVDAETGEEMILNEGE